MGVCTERSTEKEKRRRNEKIKKKIKKKYQGRKWKKKKNKGEREKRNRKYLKTVKIKENSVRFVKFTLIFFKKNLLNKIYFYFNDI